MKPKDLTKLRLVVMDHAEEAAKANLKFARAGGNNPMQLTEAQWEAVTAALMMYARNGASEAVSSIERSGLL